MANVGSVKIGFKRIELRAVATEVLDDGRGAKYVKGDKRETWPISDPDDRLGTTFGDRLMVLMVS